MNVGQAETQLVIVLCLALATIIPTAALAMKAYLQTQANRWQIEDRPTHDEVNTTVSKAVDDALKTNGT